MFCLFQRLPCPLLCTLYPAKSLHILDNHVLLVSKTPLPSAVHALPSQEPSHFGQPCSACFKDSLALCCARFTQPRAFTFWTTMFCLFQRLPCPLLCTLYPAKSLHILDNHVLLVSKTPLPSAVHALPSQ